MNSFSHSLHLADESAFDEFSEPITIEDRKFDGVVSPVTRGQAPDGSGGFSRDESARIFVRIADIQKISWNGPKMGLVVQTKLHRPIPQSYRIIRTSEQGGLMLLSCGSTSGTGSNRPEF